MSGRSLARGVLFFVMSAGLLGGCDELTTDPAIPQEAVEKAFASANPGGRLALELGGRNVWLEAGMFEPSCLESKDLAFNDDPQSRPSGAPPRISPTYQNQRWITGTSERGVCVVLGSDPKAEVTNVAYGGEYWMVDLDVKVTDPSPWFSCLTEKHRHRQVAVKIADDGTPAVIDDVSLGQGGCAPDLPGDVERKGHARPKKQPKSPPSASVVSKLAEDFDTALFNADLAAARKLTRCVNLFEDPMWDACSLGELVSVGPSFSGEQRSRDGTPWIEYTVRDIADFGRVLADKGDPTLFHVMMKHKRSGKARSFSVQYDDGDWFLFGVVGQKAEALTSMRFINDLHDRTKRDILERRVNGEKIDHQGNPLEGEEE